MHTLSQTVATRRRRLRHSLSEAATALTTASEGYPVSRELVHAWERGHTPGRRYLTALSVYLEIPLITLIRLRRHQINREKTRCTPPATS